MVTCDLTLSDSWRTLIFTFILPLKPAPIFLSKLRNLNKEIHETQIHKRIQLVTSPVRSQEQTAVLGGNRVSWTPVIENIQRSI